MKRSFIISALVISLLLVSIVSSSMIIPLNDKGKENGKALEHTETIDVDGDGEWDLARVDFIFPAKPENPGNSNKGPKQGSCYKLMGVKWKSNLPLSYSINPNNSYGLTDSFVQDTISTSSETWDNATITELFSAPSINYSAQYGIQDYKNSIDFGNLESSIIGVTSVWYTRVGKQIVEFDMRLNTDYTWGDASVDPTLMDLENIVTHEMGHTVGLDDIYASTCSNVTMYGYGTEGETSKRTLESADIEGIQSLYGI